MKWLVIISIVSVTVSFKSAFAQFQQLPGTCASISYADRCCPPGGSCTASDGTCTCDAHCFSRGDCCDDIFCTPTPLTCQDSGITQCCDDTDINNCRVNVPGQTYTYGGETYYTAYAPMCSCDPGCHGRAPPYNCCTDAVQIGCTPQTCAQAGKPAGCCQWGATSSCYVNGSANCYCDAYCFVFGDCCCDIELPATECADNRDCPNKAAASSTRQRYYGYSNFEKELMAAHVQKYTAQQQKVGVPNPAQGGPYPHRPGPIPSGPSSSQADRNEHHRLALTSRLERARVNAREFRGRARAMQRPNYYNNYYNGY